MYLSNKKELYLKRWCGGERFAVVHRQLRVRDPQKSNIFFKFFFFNFWLFLFEMVLILSDPP